MTPTSEEAKRYGLALAALDYGILVGVDEDNSLVLMPRDHTFGWNVALNRIGGTEPRDMLTAAAEVLGLEPVQFPPSAPEGYVLVSVELAKRLAERCRQDAEENRKRQSECEARGLGHAARLWMSAGSLADSDAAALSSPKETPA